MSLVVSNDFFNGEERCGYFVKPEVKKIWYIILDMLHEFMRVCDANGIKYYVCGGTLLGTVRHQGMIPWDDDIDIMMMREEYEKLLLIGPQQFKDPYFFQCESTDPGCAYGHVHICNSHTTALFQATLPVNQGIFIDVFPIDKLPNRFRSQYPYIKKMYELKNEMVRLRQLTIFYRFRFRKNLVKLLGEYLRHILATYVLKQKYSYKSACEAFDKHCMQYANRSDFHKLVLTPWPAENGIWDDEDFSETLYMPFEMFQVPVPSGYRHILDSIYGNNWHEYIIGENLHNGLLIDTEKSYKEYLK